VKFGTLTIENFMGIGEASVNLSDRGLVLIQGINKYDSSADSNGAGKSSIADALSWVLYGTTARNEGGDDIVNNETGKNCMVSVIVSEGDDEYRITRYRKHKTGKNRLEVEHLPVGVGAPTSLTKGTDKLTQSVVEQIIGCSHEVFCGAVYAGQEKMPDLPGMTDKTLKMLIEEASGATLLEACYTEANTKVRETERAFTDATAQLVTFGRHVTDAEASLALAQSRQTLWETDRKAELLAIGVQGRAKKAEIEEKIADLAKLGDAIAIRKKVEELDKAIASVAAEQAQDRKNSDAFDQASRKYASYGVHRGSMERNFKRAQQKLSELDHQVGCPCSTCDRPYSAEDIEPAKKLAIAEVTRAELEFNDASIALADALVAFQNAGDERDAYRAAMTDVSAANAERASLQEELDVIRTAEHVLQRDQAALKSIVVQIKSKRDEENPWTDEIARCEKLVEDRKAAHGVAQVTELDKQRDFKVAKHTADVFSPTGVRAFLLDDVTPFLNDQTAKYLGTLSDGNISATWTTLIKNAKGELREKFSIEVENKNGGKKFGLVSGGEKRKVRVACALALQDLVARRASKPIELFIGDEIDDALDRAGQERLIQILEEKARERGSVFIVSHASLQDWIRNQITVKRTGPRSTIEETTA
jgi:DNA repair exonuclease SbcCD ATPase subunit